MSSQYIVAIRKLINEDYRCSPLIANMRSWGILVSFVGRRLDKTGTVHGLFRYNKNRLHVQIRILDDDGYPYPMYRIIRTLAHEYRHVIQCRKGLYKSYLEGDVRGIVAVRAEQDACKFAERYLSFFYKPDEVTPFSYDYKSLFNGVKQTAVNAVK
jgi:hypothetical protein